MTATSEDTHHTRSIYVPAVYVVGLVHSCVGSCRPSQAETAGARTLLTLRSSTATKGLLILELLAGQSSTGQSDRREAAGYALRVSQPAQGQANIIAAHSVCLPSGRLLAARSNSCLVLRVRILMMRFHTRTLL